MKVFTVENGRVQEGAAIQKFKLENAGISIPAIVIGESGRGRKLGVLPVKKAPSKPCPDRGRSSTTRYDMSAPAICDQCGESYSSWEYDSQKQLWVAHHPQEGSVLLPLEYAEVGTTKSGRPCLIASELPGDNEKVIIVLRTPIGFRGGNSHTGDIAREWWIKDYRHLRAPDVPDKEEYSEEEVREYSRKLLKHNFPDEPQNMWYEGFEKRTAFHPFPGEVIAEGIIAQGGAGRMGSGQQLVAIITKGVPFRTGYSGRRYGAPREHFYVWDGEKLLAATKEEREISEIF